MTLLDQVAGAQLKLLRPSGGCHSCKHADHVVGQRDYVPATLVAGQILWLGEAPGKTEVAEQEGFVGEGGKLLRKEARAANVPEQWSFSNTIHCRPPENAAPLPREIECCLSQFVLDEIRGYPIVVLVGTVPLTALFPGANGNHFRGNFAHHPDFPGQRFYAIWHPAYLLRRPDLMDQWRRQLERLGRVARGEPAQTWISIRGHGAHEALRGMILQPAISLDLETTGTESWVPGAKIRSVSATADGKTVVSVHEDEPHFVACMELLRTFLENPDKFVIGNHAAFDVEWQERELEFRARAQLADVGIIWYEARQYKYPSLKQLVAEELDGYRWLVHRPDKLQDVDLLMRYNEEDVVHSYFLFRKGMELLKPRTRDLVLQSFCPMAMQYERAHTKGIYIRQDYRRAKIDEYAERRRVAIAAWRAADPAFVPDEHESGKGLAKYLFEIKGLPVLGWTAKEQEPQVDQESIKKWIQGGATYLEHLLTMRSIDTIVGTFLKAFDKHIGPDSRIRPTHWLTSTFTSRPSSSDPNVYNMPTKSEIRDLFGAPPGAWLMESDLSQIEFRIMVCLSHDETGIEAYKRGDDAHTATARMISGNPTPTKKQRTDAKPVNFGNLYGAHWRTAQRQAFLDYGVIWTDEEAQRFQEMFFATYTRMRPYHDHVKQEMITNRGWFESVTGHVWHYDDWDHPEQEVRDHAYRAYLNSKAQGPAANICYFIAAQTRRILDERGMQNALMVNSVYDSIMYEIPDPKWVRPVINATNEAAQLALEWVRSWFVVPLVIEHSVGQSWGSMTEVKELAGVAR